MTNDEIERRKVNLGPPQALWDRYGDPKKERRQARAAHEASQPVKQEAGDVVERVARAISHAGVKHPMPVTILSIQAERMAKAALSALPTTQQNVRDVSEDEAVEVMAKAWEENSHCSFHEDKQRAAYRALQALTKEQLKPDEKEIAE